MADNKKITEGYEYVVYSDGGNQLGRFDDPKYAMQFMELLLPNPCELPWKEDSVAVNRNVWMTFTIRIEKQPRRLYSLDVEERD